MRIERGPLQLSTKKMDIIVMDKNKFCDFCKCLREEEAKYCVECGVQLRAIATESLALEEVNCENICKFLVDRLGYKGASWHDECTIIAKYDTDSNSPKGRELLSTPEDVLFIDIEDDHICISALIQLRKDPSDDIQFFKLLNSLNVINESFLNFSYVEPDEEEDIENDNNLKELYGNLKLSWKIPYIPNLPLIHLYRLCLGGFERSIIQKMNMSYISPLFADYFGLIVNFHAPRNRHITV
jgi:hypothetical protein